MIQRCPGYFGDRGHVDTVQPNLGLDELVGVRESYVEFTPDLLNDLKLNLDGVPVWGGLFLQAYQPNIGKPVGWYEDGQVAAVDHTFGEGQTKLIGTMVGSGYYTHPGNRSAVFLARLMEFVGKQQHVWCSDPRVKARLHNGKGGMYLWVANPTRRKLPIRLEIGVAWGSFSSARSLWGNDAETDGHTITLTAGARDVSVIALTSS